MKRLLFIMALCAALFVSCDKDQLTVELSEDSLSLSIGDSKTLTAKVSPDGVKKALSWKSSDTEIATVENGLVTAVAAGSATITATIGDVSASCEVKVCPPVESITLSPPSLMLRVGEMSQVAAIVRPRSALDRKVTWKSLNPEVATVDQEGWVYSQAAGNATITASAGGVTANLNVVVMPDIDFVTVPYLEDFEDTLTFDNWTIIDQDGDGYAWWHIQKENLENISGFTTHDGDGCASSSSYMNSIGALTPDNWLISPIIQLNSSSNYLCCWLGHQDTSGYDKEHYAVYISEYATEGPSTEGCTLLTEGTITQGNLTESYVLTETIDSRNWEKHVVRIPDQFNGKLVYISFRHFDCTDMFWLNVDDVSITVEDPRKVAAPKKISSPRKPQFTDNQVRK